MKPTLELKNGSKICVVTAYNDTMKELGDFTSSHNLVYCQNWGYDFRVYTQDFEQLVHPAWSKIIFVQDALKDYEWVFWIDADAVFTNFSLDIERYIQLGADLFLAKEIKDVFNTGVFLIRRNEWSFWLLGELWKMRNDKHEWWEQGAFNKLAFQGKCGNRMVHYRMSDIQTSPSPLSVLDYHEGWSPEHFIAHVLGPYTQKEKLHYLKQCLKQAKSPSKRSSKKRVCVVTGYTSDGDWKQLGDFTSGTKQAYCRKWGYDFRICTTGFDDSSSELQNKLSFIKDALNDYEWVLWTDADAMITNPNISLEPFLESKEELVIAQDNYGKLNTGVFFLRDSAFAQYFLDEVLRKKNPKPDIRELSNGHIRIESGKRFNSFYGNENCSDGSPYPESLQWKPGDFIAHFTDRPLSHKMQDFHSIMRILFSKSG